MVISPATNARVELRRRRGLCYVNVVEGDLDPTSRRSRESDLFGRLARAQVTVTMVVVNDGGCSFAVDAHDIPRVQAAASGINMAVRTRPKCSLVRLCFGHDDEAHLAQVMAAVASAELTVVHLAVGLDTVSVLVDEKEGTRAAHALQQCAQSFLHAA